MRKEVATGGRLDFFLDSDGTLLRCSACRSRAPNVQSSELKF